MTQHETLATLGSFPSPMRPFIQPNSESDSAGNRKIIQIDGSDDHSGIMVALRHAFQAAATAPSDHDFAELLRKLN